MYKETPKTRKYRLMREAKERKRIESGEREEFKPLPDLRREIIVINHDNGEVHSFRMFKTNRIDQYRVLVDGKPWKDKTGFSKVLLGTSNTNKYKPLSILCRKFCVNQSCDLILLTLI